MQVPARVGVLLVAAVLVVWLASPGLAQSEAEMAVTVEGRDAATMDANEPLVLEADEPIEVSVRVDNPGDEALLVRSVRLRSTVVGLTFVAYETRVDMEVPAGESAERTFRLDLLGLNGQAIGLLPAAVELLDAQRDQITAVPITVDVQGSYASVYGGFALAVAAITALVLARNLTRLASGRLPANRWTRAVHFGAPGIGVGLVATFTVSALRVFSPEAAVWGPLLAGFGAAFFVWGYLTPAPERDEDLAEDELAEEMAISGARATAGPHDPPPTERAAPATLDDDRRQESAE